MPFQEFLNQRGERTWLNLYSCHWDGRYLVLYKISLPTFVVVRHGHGCYAVVCEILHILIFYRA